MKAAVTLLLVLGALLVVFTREQPNEDSIPLVVNIAADLHAGNNDFIQYVENKENLIYPVEWEEHYRKFLSSPGDFYILLGDISNNKRSEKYAGLVKEVTEEVGKEVYFVQGNHDGNEAFKILSEKPYYSFDKGDWRFVVLNSEEWQYETSDEKYGGYSDKQLSWLEEQVNTEKNVVLVSSKPAFLEDLETKKGGNWERFYQTLQANRNIKHFVAGDYHIVHETREHSEFPGISFHYVGSLVLESHKGRFLRLELR